MGVFVGGSYFGGDVMNVFVSGCCLKFMVYDVNVGYEYGNIFVLLVEYVINCYDKVSLLFNIGVSVVM